MRCAPRAFALRRNIPPSFANNYQTLKLKFVDQAALEAALGALKALALELSRALGLIRRALEVVLSSARDCQALSLCSSAKQSRSRLGALRRAQMPKVLSHAARSSVPF